MLVVEDHVDVLETTRCLIEAAGYHALCAENGQTALRLLCQQKELPRAILLDLMMPLMDGWQLLNELQRNVAFAKIPVVVVSALDLDASNFPSAAGYLRKPVRYERLLAVLAGVCEDTCRSKDNMGRTIRYADTPKRAEHRVMLGNQLDL